MTRSIWIVAATAIAIASALPTAAAEPRPPRPDVEKGRVEVTDDIRIFARSGKAFAFDLYARLRREEGNLFFSPASISAALAMVHAGAAGETEREMASVLHLDLPVGRLSEAAGAFSSLLNSDDKAYRLSMANRLWGAQRFPFLPAYLELTRSTFGAELATLDFGRTEAARAEINGWVENQTNGKIRDLVPAGVIKPETRLVLTNAIYFKGGWEAEFPETATKDAPFLLPGGGKVAVPLMHLNDRFAYAEAEGVQMVELPYGGGDLSMLVLLPRSPDGLPAFEETLTRERFEDLFGAARERDVDLFLPRFEATSRFRLSDTLATMGMASAFGERADFSGISSAESLMLTEVVHQAFVDVNEQGTEAAAATGVILAPTSAAQREPEPPVVFRADRPFVFLIRDRRTGAVLFLGRISNPAD